MKEHWRGQGIRVVLYLDDGRASQTVRQDLAKAGLVSNQQKSQWEPVRKLKWLGFQINLHVGQMFIPEIKLANLCILLESPKQRQAIPAKLLASLIGKIVSMSLALGPATRLMTRSLYTTLNSRPAACFVTRCQSGDSVLAEQH